MSTLVVAAIGTAVIVTGNVQFVGQATCPEPAQVARAFAPLAEVENPGSPAEAVTVSIERDGRSTVIRFSNDDDAAVAVRVLPAHMSCAERAKAAAVIVATHLQERTGPEKARALPVPEPGEITVKRSQTPTESEAGEPFASDHIDIGALAARAGAELATGARLGFVHTVRKQQFRGLVNTMGIQRVPVAGGWATWRRLTVGLGYGRRWAAETGRHFLDLGIDLLASRVALGSEGFLRPENSATFHPGLAAMIQGGRKISPDFGLCGGVGTNFWPRRQRVFLSDVNQATTLPRFELWATVGDFWTLR
ncbi:MAG TPA: hypothetical protein VGF45_25020 [Polyangia bacterium]